VGKADPAEYWREHKYLTDYIPDTNEKTKKLVKLMAPFLLGDSLSSDEVVGSLHEFGCCVCRNLVKLKRTFPLLEVSGNDINRAALKYNKQENPEILVIEASTDVYLKEMKPVTYILTMAHLMHLPFEMDEVLKEHISKSFTNFYFCVEQEIRPENIKVSKQRGDRKGGNKYGRGRYEDFFSDSLRVVKKVRFDRIGGNYFFIVFEHK